MAHCGSVRSHVCYGFRMDTNTHRTATGTTAAEQIKEWARLADEAAGGPWEWAPYMRSGSALVCRNPAAHETSILKTIDDWPPHVCDRAFIAASRTAVPAMAAALQAVLEVHSARQLYALDPLNGTWIYVNDERIEFGKLCHECTADDDADEYEPGEYVEWPCATVEAITAALGVES